MALTAAQLQVIKDDIAANGDLNAHPNTPDGNAAVADLYNLDASPDYIVWKTSVPLDEIGTAIDGQNLADITTANNERTQSFFVLNPAGAIPQRADHRAFFDDVFSGANGATTRGNLDALWRRLASRIEKLLAAGSGDGSTGDPDTLVFEDAITRFDVEAARNLP